MHPPCHAVNRQHLDEARHQFFDNDIQEGRNSPAILRRLRFGNQDPLGLQATGQRTDGEKDGFARIRVRLGDAS